MFRSSSRHGTLINFSDLNIKMEKSKVSERVHPDLRGISFSAPLLASEDKEDIKEKAVAKNNYKFRCYKYLQAFSSCYCEFIE